jgi:hypothetical protein
MAHEYNIFFQHYQSVISLRFDTHHSPCFGSCLLTLSVCIAGLWGKPCLFLVDPGSLEAFALGGQCHYKWGKKNHLLRGKDGYVR